LEFEASTDDMTLRRCIKCGKEKSEQDFYVEQREKPVMMTVCKRCHIETVRRRTIERKAASGASAHGLSTRTAMDDSYGDGSR
jgi:NAD-dependent SIR2 family protein deacetylase